MLIGSVPGWMSSTPHGATPEPKHEKLAHLAHFLACSSCSQSREFLHKCVEFLGSCADNKKIGLSNKIKNMFCVSWMVMIKENLVILVVLYCSSVELYNFSVYRNPINYY